MGVREDIRSAAAQVALDILKTFGVQVTFSHRGAAAVTIWVDAGDQNFAAESESRGIVDEIREIVFTVPLQTGFAAATAEAEPVSPGDKITYLSRDWFVQTIERDAVGAVYTLRCTQRKRLSSGVG